MIFKIILLTIAISLIPCIGHTAVYGFVDEGGTYHFTNMVPVGKKFRIIISDRIKSIVTKHVINNTDYDTMIAQHAANHGIDPLLIKAVMKAESNFNPRALSHKGAQGLMQLMPDTARLMKVEDPFDPDDNIKGGARYLKYLDDIFGGNIELILAGYNAGPRRVIENKMNVPPYEETKTYIQRVKSYYNKLKKPHES
jgi:soluble lytic murein transglycosylase-like protein